VTASPENVRLVTETRRRLNESRLAATRRVLQAWRWCGNPDCTGEPHDGRGKHARHGQRAPQPGVRTTYYRGGRGSGKTWCAVHAFAERFAESGQGEWGLVSPTFADARSMAVESPESGLLAALGTSKAEVEAGRSRLVSSWNRSLGELTLRSGARLYATGAENGAVRIQGKNLRGVLADEIGLWDRWETAWDESIRMATRIEGAFIIATGTPKSARKSKKLVRRLIDDPKVDNRLLRTGDNARNLSREFLEDVTGGLTLRLSRQELEGELVDDPEGALWSWEILDACRVEKHPPLVMVVIAVDPAMTSGEESDETGIVVAGKGEDGHGYVLADLSLRAHPAEVARRIAAAYEDHRANTVVAEVNNGGDYVGTLIKGVQPDIGYRTVHATRGKYLRAEPVAALYEQNRVHHVGRFEKLEEQMAQFEPGMDGHDDRCDAMVYAITALKVEGAGMTWLDVYAPQKDDKEKRDDGPDSNPWLGTYGRPAE
jgi:predicted phage terminase large subunit-like protein